MSGKVETTLTTQHGIFRILCYGDDNITMPDFALVHGTVAQAERVLTRVQSECLTGHVLQSLSCDCYEQLQDSLAAIRDAGCGILIYLRQEGRGIGLAAKLESYVLQKRGMDTVEANLHLGYAVDERKYDTAVTMLTELEVSSIRLLTNNPDKVRGLRSGGINVAEVIALPPCVRDQNRRYLATKAAKMGHTIQV